MNAIHTIKQWPSHEGHVDLRREHYELYSRYGISGEELNHYGLLSYIVRGNLVKEIYDKLVNVGPFMIGMIDTMAPYVWMGGCSPNRQASLDFKLNIPSQDIKKNGTLYTTHIKTERKIDRLEDEYFITGNIIQKSITHACESNGYHTLIQRFTPCKHFIAAQLILQERSEDWCNSMEEEFYHDLKVGKVYKVKEGLPIHVFDQIPEEIMALYLRGTKGMNQKKIHSINREAAILHAAAKWKYLSGLLTHEQLDTIEPLLESNGDI